MTPRDAAGGARAPRARTRAARVRARPRTGGSDRNRAAPLKRRAAVPMRFVWNGDREAWMSVEEEAIAAEDPDIPDVTEWLEEEEDEAEEEYPLFV